MKCPEVGCLRAYVDRELAMSEDRQVAQHLDECGRCAQVLRQLESDAAFSHAKLALLDSAVSSVPAPGPALSRFRRRYELSETEPAKVPVSGRIGAQLMNLMSLGWKLGAGVAVALCLVAVLAVAPVRSAAEGVLSQFRVQKFAAVTVDPTQIPEVPNPDQLGTLEVVGSPQVQNKVSLSEAQGMVPFKLKTPSYLPAGVPTSPQVMASDDASFTYTIDRDKLEAYLIEIGLGGTRLSDDLDGAVVRGHVPTMVAALYSETPAEGATPTEDITPKGPSVILVQGESPSYEVPDELMVLRDELLALPNLPAGLVSQMAAIDNWQSTVVVPLPAEATSRDVTVLGQPGLSITHEGASALLWEQNGIVYGLAGNVSEAELLKVAESLR